MILNKPILLVEISNNNCFMVAVENNNNNFKQLHEIISINNFLKENMIENFEKTCDMIRSRIYSIEKEINYTIKEVIIFIDNSNCSIINLTGYKKLNGSQLSRENITYLLNSLKSQINEIEKKKTVLHIFNSKYLLDKKKTDNLPIGLFGNFYSQELSFFLADTNYLKNLNNLFNKCNLRVKKVVSKSFIEGVNLINNDTNLENFFLIEIHKERSKVILFENSALKFFQNFNFGSDLIIKDISKVIGLKDDVIKKILKNLDFKSENLEKQLIEEEYFSGQNFRKVNKKLILNIANARIQEIVEILFSKNINFLSFFKKNIPLYLDIGDKTHLDYFKSNYHLFFSNKDNLKVIFTDNFDYPKFFEIGLSLVQYGWKKEAIPIVQEKKSFISRFFNLIFD